MAQPKSITAQNITISSTVTPKMLKDIDEYAEKQGISRSHAINKIIKKGLETMTLTSHSSTPQEISQANSLPEPDIAIVELVGNMILNNPDLWFGNVSTSDRAANMAVAETTISMCTSLLTHHSRLKYKFQKLGLIETEPAKEFVSQP